MHIERRWKNARHSQVPGSCFSYVGDDVGHRRPCLWWPRSNPRRPLSSTAVTTRSSSNVIPGSRILHVRSPQWWQQQRRHRRRPIIPYLWTANDPGPRSREDAQRRGGPGFQTQIAIDRSRSTIDRRTRSSACSVTDSPQATVFS